MMNLDVYHSLIFGGMNKHRLDDRDWGSDYFHVAAATTAQEVEAAIGGGDQGIDEDDILYAELSRQVLLLTADDDEDIEAEEARRYRFDDVNGYGNFMMMKRSTSVNSKEGYNWSNVGSAVADFTAGINNHPYFNLWESSNDQYGNLPTAGGNGASWQGNSWGSPVNMGTGVFIPHVANSKRRNRRGKKNGKKRAAASKAAGESKQ